MCWIANFFCDIVFLAREILEAVKNFVFTSGTMEKRMIKKNGGKMEKIRSKVRMRVQRISK
jgi:Rad3-related DNA helicase